MRQAYDRILKSISGSLRAQNDNIPQEPLPRRWVDLINFLEERERSLPRAPQSEGAWQKAAGSRPKQS